jgi:HK97 gp10 family phage protein
MPDGIEFKITGLKELQDKLERLPPLAARRAIREGLKDAPRPWLEQMKVTVRRYSGPELGIPPGFLADHIVIRTKVAGDGLSGSARVGPQKIDYPDRAGGYRKKKNKRGGTKNVGRVSLSRVAQFLEFGTRRSRKFPFIRPAFESLKVNVLDRFIGNIKTSLEGAGLRLR